MHVGFNGTKGEKLSDYMLAKLNRVCEAFVAEGNRRERPSDYMFANYMMEFMRHGRE